MSITRRKGRSNPVVHIAFEDAEAYTHWAGKPLPTEAQWELSARGGLVSMIYTWGDQPGPEGARLANYWHGAFHGGQTARTARRLRSAPFLRTVTGCSTWRGTCWNGHVTGTRLSP